MEKINGLSSSEVQEKIRQGKVNTASKSMTKPVAKIITDNVFTLFNAINLALFTLVLLAGSPKNGLFMVIIGANIFIGIVQEIRAKQVVDKLRVLTEPHTTVIRDGKEQEISSHDLVHGDVFVPQPGTQIVVDGTVLESESLEVDESLLTGESHSVIKHKGDILFSGSYVVAGRGVAVTTAVGEDCYAGKLTKEAKNFTPVRSEIMTTLKKIIKFVTFVIAPVGLLLFFSQFLRSGESWQDVAVSTTAALIGMIPEGLVLLTSVAFAVGMIKLALKRTVVQESPGIEMLARVDVLCLDKTGTLTKGVLSANDVSYQTQDTKFADDCIAAVCHAFPDKNATSQALCNKFSDAPTWKILNGVPFSSARKWSGAQFENISLIMGAPEFLLEDAHPLRAISSEHAKNGLRVILVAQVGGFSESNYTGDVSPLALITIFDDIKEDAEKTLSYFKSQGVCIKVISGDNPVTVSNVAARVGLENADKYIDTSTLTDEELALVCEDYSVFGRVSPSQKKILVEALKERNHVVAMTGDGTNDVAALQASNCGIAMASGTDAARGVSQIVLLDSDFSSLPSVVAEGRRVINNIERVASLFLVKTMFSMLLCVAFIILGQKYPFEPLHLSLISTSCVGIPSFFLALEPNNTRAVPGFLRKVLVRAFPAALSVTICVLIVEFMMLGGIFSKEVATTLDLFVLFTASFTTLVSVCFPINPLRIGLMILGASAFGLAVVFLPWFFDIAPIPNDLILSTVGICGLTLSLILLVKRFLMQWFSKHPLMKKINKMTK